jgi:hypothetical protein
MIGQIMREINQYWAKTYENISLAFNSSGKTITGVFGETYLAGQYILIQHSVLNDGVFTLVSVEDELDEDDEPTGNTVITVSETVRTETNTVNIFGLAPPRDFIDLVTEIIAFTSKDGVTSESIDDYSVSFEGDGSWKTAFRKRLNNYRRMHSDLGGLLYANNRLLQYYNGIE